MTVGRFDEWWSALTDDQRARLSTSSGSAPLPAAGGREVPDLSDVERERIVTAWEGRPRLTTPRRPDGTLDLEAWLASGVEDAERRAAARFVAQVRGRHYTAYPETVKQLKREARYDEALRLLAECHHAARAEARVQVSRTAPWYIEQMAIILKKLKRPDEERAALEELLLYASKQSSIDRARKRLAELQAASN